MRRKILWMVLLTAGLMGCASTQKQATANEAQIRISELERQMEERDAQIAGLNGDIENLTDELKRKESSPETIISSSRQTTTGKSDIIRVDATPQKIQLALQNAGYYDGPIDGKVGAKTRRAITEFQKANNLNADGILGAKTWSSLKTHLN